MGCNVFGRRKGRYLRREMMKEDYVVLNVGGSGGIEWIGKVSE